MIKDFFLNYEAMVSDFTLELGTKQITRLNGSPAEADWRISFIETGDSTQTGGRLKRLQPYLAGESSFLLTYGDGVSDVDLGQLVRFHQRSACAVVT